MTRTKTLTDDVVLSRALEVILEKGAAKFTLRQVAQKVGLSPATILQRFGTRNLLLAKAIHFHNDKERERLILGRQRLSANRHRSDPPLR